jgi:hypothetical protein
MGNAAMESNLTGGSNTAVGSQALNKNKNSYNTAVGQYSMFNNVNGGYNTAVGASALQGTTGTFNTGIGYNASVATGDGVTNATAIGNGASASASNTIQLGNTSVTDVKTSGKITAAGAEFTKSATNSVAFDAGSSTSINFSNSNLAYTTAVPQAFTLTGMKDGGTYTLAVRGSGTNTSSFSGNNPSGTAFTFTSLGNYAATSNKHTLYTFIVMGSVVYFSMVSAQ